jgi:hypothetical protein
MHIDTLTVYTKITYYSLLVVVKSKKMKEYESSSYADSAEITVQG